jgi:hypothetical protein
MLRSTNDAEMPCMVTEISTVVDLTEMMTHGVYLLFYLYSCATDKNWALKTIPV